MTIAIIGALGQLGADMKLCLERAGHIVIPVYHQDAEISDNNSLTGLLSTFNADVIINTAAMHNMEACEKDPAKAFAVNGLGAKYLAEYCNPRGIKLIHISTNYVFGGDQRAPYWEADQPWPLNVYANTKLSGEHFVGALCPSAVILRVGALYGKHPCRAKGGLNFVLTMLKLAKERGLVKVVDDEFVSPTHTADIAEQTKLILEQPNQCGSGIIHCSSQDWCSWYDFAAAIFELTGTKVDLQRAASNPSPINRPKYSVLANRRLNDAGMDIMPHWRDALQNYLSIK